MNLSTKQKIGWVMSVLLSAFLILASASGKFTDWEGKAEMFEKIGYSQELMFSIGIVEVLLAVSILIPKIAFIGALLLTAYLGGATATHVRVGEPFFFPILVGVFLWIAIACRIPGILPIVLGKNT